MAEPFLEECLLITGEKLALLHVTLEYAPFSAAGIMGHTWFCSFKILSGIALLGTACLILLAWSETQPWCLVSPAYNLPHCLPRAMPEVTLCLGYKQQVLCLPFLTYLYEICCSLAQRKYLTLVGGKNQHQRCPSS